jgi:hypothetical protein
MLDVFRLEKGTFKIANDIVDMSTICQHAVKLVGPSMRNTVVISTDCPQTTTLLVVSDTRCTFCQIFQTMASIALNMFAIKSAHAVFDKPPK